MRGLKAMGRLFSIKRWKPRDRQELEGRIWVSIGAFYQGYRLARKLHP